MNGFVNIPKGTKNSEIVKSEKSKVMSDRLVRAHPPCAPFRRKHLKIHPYK
jgi:hypothetical protein